MSLYDPVSHRSLVHQIGVYPQVTSQGQLGIDALCLGFPDHGLALSSEAVAEARRLDHPPSLALSLAVDALLLVLVDSAALEASAAQLIAVALQAETRAAEVHTAQLQRLIAWLDNRRDPEFTL